MKKDPLYKIISTMDIDKEIMAMRKDTLPKMILTTAKRLGDYGNE